MYIVFDIGGTSTKCAVVKETGEILEKDKFLFQENYSKFLSKIENYIDKVLSNEEYQIKGICFSSPGSVDKNTGEIGGTSALYYIHENNFAKKIHDKYKLNVSIENDANCSALGEIYFSKQDYKSALFLVIGTGIGGSVIKDNKLINGNKNEAGEFGYMLLKEENGEFKNFSVLGTVKNTSKKIKEELGIDIGGKDLIKKHSLKEEPYFYYVDNMFKYLAMGIYNLKYFYDPEIILIGGAVSQNKNFIKSLKEKLNESPFNTTEINIRACKYYNDSNILGALANFLQGNICKF